MEFIPSEYLYKILKIKIITTIIFLINLQLVNAQIFSSEQNPPSVKWMQINLPSFQIIYQAELDPEAHRMANTLQAIITPVSASLKIKPRKISILLQNRGTTSNGFVQLAPRRSEFFTTPGQEFDYQDWLNSLAVHELRHVVQLDKLTGNLKAPFFEDLAFTIFGVTLPSWFFEGDAVGTETALTNAGRGRQPEWDLTFRTNTLSKKKYNYSKNFIGSLNSLTPGYYQLGYFMTTKLKKDEGRFILDSVFRRMNSNYLRPYNLSNSIKKFTGSGTRKLHDSTVAELENLWQKQQEILQPADHKSLNKRSKVIPEFFLLPTPIEKANEFLVLKESKAHTNRISRIDSFGNEHLIIKIGLQEEPHFSYAVQKIVWDEFRYDKRYQKRSFNVINTYDISTKSYRQLTYKTRLFAPSLSPDGKIIVTVEINLSNKITLVELNAETGKELRRFASPDNLMLQTPRYNPGGSKIIMTAVSKEGKTLLELNKSSGTFTQLIAYQKQLISRPVYAGNQIIFKAHYNGIDNLYSLDTATKTIAQITNVKFGAYNPSFDSAAQKIYFNNYQVLGYDVASISAATPKLKANSLPPATSTYSETLRAQEGDRNIFDSIPNEIFAVKPYNEVKNLLYFHSVLPLIEEVNNDYRYGLQFQSDNKLNTVSFYAGYEFNNALKKSEYFTGLSYSRYYPIFDFTYRNRGRLNYLKIISKNPNTPPSYVPYTWRENVTEFNITIPFIFNRLNRTYRTGFRTGTSYTDRYDFVNKPKNLVRSLNFPMHGQFYFYNNVQRSARDLAPRWGQNFTLGYKKFPFDRKVTGELLTFESSFYLPGLALNHSFQASFNYQTSGGYYNSNLDIPLVSGYSNLNHPQKIRNTLLLDYRFPLFYPDWEVGPLAYVKRFKGGFFADFENIGKGNKLEPLTYGAELTADMNLLRFYLPNFSLGGKIIFVNQKPSQNPIFEAIAAYNF